MATTSFTAFVGRRKHRRSGATKVRATLLTTTLLTTTLLAITLLASCATEVVDLEPPAVTAQDDNVTNEIAPDASLSELTELLRDEVTVLSEAIFVSNRDAARTSLERIDKVWILMEPLIVAEFGELADQLTYDLRRVIELARSAVERNRPADADKAKAFLALALTSLASLDA